VIVHEEGIADAFLFSPKSLYGFLGFFGVPGLLSAAEPLLGLNACAFLTVVSIVLTLGGHGERIILYGLIKFNEMYNTDAGCMGCGRVITG
jgi:hypothetical protein